MATIISPWSSELVADYERLMKVFGVEPLNGLLNRFPRLNRYLRRGIAFGHRGLNVVLDAIEQGKEYAVLSGIKPAGEFHLGSKITAEQIIFFQSLSPRSKTFYCIADIEAWEDNGQPLKKSAEYAIDNVADLLALGIDYKRTYFYFQSREPRVMRRAAVFARGISIDTMTAIYGKQHIGMYLSALIQVADILLPQHEDFGGPKPTVVPVGIDQDPHIRFTRDLARKYKNMYGFIEPAAVYHKLHRSLLGEKKMSKRDPMSCITLNDDPELAAKKVMRAYTGGRETAELQRKLGGQPGKCVVFELLAYHLIEDDKELQRIYDACTSGALLCGECKRRAAELMANMLKEHQRKKQKFLDLARSIVEEALTRTV